MIQCATPRNKHHLFGFHDLIAFNRSGDKLLSLETNVINRPPLPGEEFGVGYTLWQEQRFVRLGTTVAMNYPQGARQQWLNDRQFIANNRIGNHWGADIYDVELQKKLASIDSTAHVVTSDSKYALGINYSRLHRLGGYGYIGIDDFGKEEEAPSDDGIYITNITQNMTRLLVSIREVSECNSESSAHNGFHHYLTHLVLSPDNKRVAFLHRFFLSDGGLRTRLMTIGIDGKDLRCLGFGFLSHFDWKDNNHIFIWGRTGSSVDAIRSNKLLSNPLVSPLLKPLKSIVRTVLKKSSGLTNSFLLIEDSANASYETVAKGIIDCDGHPMFCPTNRNLIICDTYPDKNESRYLFFYDFEKNERTNIGNFRRLLELPDISMQESYTKGVDKRILGLMSPELFSFTRSGLHCDLHPRWNFDGTKVAFDSIHEGTRQIYIASKENE